MTHTTPIFAIEYTMHVPPHGIDEETADDYYLESSEAQEAAYRLALGRNCSDEDIDIVPQRKNTESCELHLILPNGFIKVMQKSLYESGDD